MHEVQEGEVPRVRGKGGGWGVQDPRLLRRQHVPDMRLVHGVRRHQGVQDIQQHVLQGDGFREEIGPPRRRRADQGDWPRTARRAHGEHGTGGDEEGEVGVSKKSKCTNGNFPFCYRESVT